MEKPSVKIFQKMVKIAFSTTKITASCSAAAQQDREVLRLHQGLQPKEQLGVNKGRCTQVFCFCLRDTTTGLFFIPAWMIINVCIY